MLITVCLTLEATGDPPRPWLRLSAARHRLSWARLLLATANSHLSSAGRRCRMRPCCSGQHFFPPNLSFLLIAFKAQEPGCPLYPPECGAHALPCTSLQWEDTLTGPAELFFTNQGAMNSFSDNKKLRQIIVSTPVL